MLSQGPDMVKQKKESVEHSGQPVHQVESKLIVLFGHRRVHPHRCPLGARDLSAEHRSLAEKRSASPPDGHDRTLKPPARRNAACRVVKLPGGPWHQRDEICGQDEQRFDIVDLRDPGGLTDGGTIENAVDSLNVLPTGLVDREVRLRMRIISEAA